jgi:hypothetical protein
MADEEFDDIQGEVPEGVGPDVFRERLQQVTRDGAEHGAHITLEDEDLFLEDIESVEIETTDADPADHRSRVRLRNGVIIGGLTGAAIVAALATIRYRRRHRQ